MESITSALNYGDIPNYGIVLMSVSAALVATILLLELFLLPARRKTNSSLANELLSHVVITGGSSGIGFSVAKELIEHEAKVITLLARNQGKLDEAKEKLEKYAKDHAEAKKTNDAATIIQVVSVDVSDTEKMMQVAKDICTSSKQPIPTSLLNVAGTSTAAAFVDTDFSEFQRLININYLGSVYATRAFLPFMLNDSQGIKPRSIVFTSSQAGQLGIYGFTAYSASKFALRGMAESLHMELANKNVSVQLLYPPDTDTPGFELEQVDKPEICRVISETSGLFSSEHVAKKMVKHMLVKRPPFNIYIGLDGFMLSTLTSGMSPGVNLLDVLCQTFLSGLFRFVSLFYLWDFRNTVKKIETRNSKAKKVEEAKKEQSGKTDDN